VESLTCTREKGNRHEIFAVAVKKDDSTTVGHVPWEISCICNLIIRDGGLLHGSVTGSRRYSCDIPERSMEIPCDCIFSGSALLTEKTIGHLKELQKKVPAIRTAPAQELFIFLKCQKSV